jgi:hypothetical protein
MPELDNPQLRTFCNEVLRPAADAMARLDLIAPGIAAEYNQKLLGTVIDSGGSSNLVADGSAVDGRTRVAGGDVYNLITLIAAFRTFIDASGRRDVLAKWQVNGLRD